MIDTYKVSNFYTNNVIDGINEYNLSSINIKDFEFTSFEFTMVYKSEEYRPDLLCYRIYGTIEYWWILLEINNISNIWDEFVEETLIKYPPISDMQKLVEFFKENKGKNG